MSLLATVGFYPASNLDQKGNVITITEQERRARRRIDTEVGALCRARREQAGVSLGEMARRVHRDASSLSRFERGQVRPRDSESLVASYRELAPPAVAAQIEAQRHRSLHWWPLAYLALSLLGLAAVSPIEQDLAHPILHAWSATSIAVALPAFIAWMRGEGVGDQFGVFLMRMSYIATLLGLGAREIIYFHSPVSPIGAVFTITAVSLLLVGLAFRDEGHI